MIYILQFAFKGTFVSFDGVHGMAQNTFCIADLAIKNCGSESNILIQLCVSDKYDLPRITVLILYIPHLQYISEPQTWKKFCLAIVQV